VKVANVFFVGLKTFETNVWVQLVVSVKGMFLLLYGNIFNYGLGFVGNKQRKRFRVENFLFLWGCFG